MKKLFALLVCVALLSAGAALAEDTKLTVSGKGTVMVESDLAIISLGVREVAGNVPEAQSAVNKKIAAVKQALLDAGVSEEEISTDSIDIHANNDYSGETETIVNYTAANSLSVRTTNIKGVGALIDAAFAAGANTLDGVRFTVQDDTKAGEQALTLAVADATRKAKVLAEAAGLQIQSIESITENVVSYYEDARLSAADKSSAEGTLVQAALVGVSASITMEFELR